MKKAVKGLALILACLQLAVCFGCGSSGKSEKKSSSSKSKSSSGFDTPDEAVEAYLNAFIENDSKKLYQLSYDAEMDLICEYVDFEFDLSKKKLMEHLDNAMSEISEDISRHPIDEWESSNSGYEDITDDFLSTDDEYYEFKETADAYMEIGLQKMLMYDGVWLEHYESGDFVQCLEDDIVCVQFGGKWYPSAQNLIYAEDY